MGRLVAVREVLLVVGGGSERRDALGGAARLCARGSVGGLLMSSLSWGWGLGGRGLRVGVVRRPLLLRLLLFLISTKKCLCQYLIYI